MKLHFLIAASLCFTPVLIAQTGHAATSGTLSPKTTLPIVFKSGLDANHAHAGDVVHARTTQSVALSDGKVLPAGADVTGHVIAANAFALDKTPYAVQKQSSLSIRFDTISSNSATFPLNVYVRAIADPVTSWGARESTGTDDTLATVTQIGGDVLTPSQSEVVSQDGDIVGYNRHGGVYAHLIAASGNAPNGCDGSDTEVSVGIYSASACGLYGFTGTRLQQTGKTGEPSTLVLTSNRVAPKVWKNSTALLEVLSQDQVVATR
jgi:hypothetical protein